MWLACEDGAAGLRLLFAENSNKGRIDGLAQNGVRFAACANTLRNVTRLMEEKPALNGSATVVDAGVVRIIDLVSHDCDDRRPVTLFGMMDEEQVRIDVEKNTLTKTKTNVDLYTAWTKGQFDF